MTKSQFAKSKPNVERFVFFVLLFSVEHLSFVACYNIHQRVYLEGHNRVEIPEGWTQSDIKIKENIQARLTIGLKRQSEDILMEKFWSVSDPDNPDYGKYMTLEEIASLISPLSSNIEVVRSWLMSHGITSMETVVTKDYLTVVAPVRVVEEMFQVTLHYFDSIYDNRRILRANRPYSVPAELSSAIDIVFGLTNFPAVTRPVISGAKRSARQFAPPVYPNNIKKVLHVGDMVGSSRADNIQAVVQFDNQYYSPDDLSYFLNYFGLPNQTISNVIGNNDPANPGEEATLDVQYIMGIGTNVSTWFYSISTPNNDTDPFLDWLLLMSNETQIPTVISVSYGGPENSFTLKSVTRCNVEFVKAGLRGSTILFASGDSGVGCNGNCTSFVPNWPASSPYVTAVGGIQLDKESPFTVEGDSISGGGFSSYFGMPKYQQNAVAGYIAKNKLPPTSFYNVSGRGIPDLASFSENVIVFMGGGEVGAAGTSCSAPITAGILSLINDALLQKGKPPLGFFNQLLYKLTPKYPKAIYGSNGYNCCPGFSCAAGWDPVTGLGVTMFDELRDAIFEYLGYL